MHSERRGCLGSGPSTLFENRMTPLPLFYPSPGRPPLPSESVKVDILQIILSCFCQRYIPATFIPESVPLSLRLPTKPRARSQCFQRFFPPPSDLPPSRISAPRQHSSAGWTIRLHLPCFTFSRRLGCEKELSRFAAESDPTTLI